MNRRGFFKRLTTGLVGAYIATSLPINWLPTKARVEGLQMIMTKAFNEFTKGRGSRSLGRVRIYASHGVFEQFSSELTCLQRFTTGDEAMDKTPSIMFKSVTMYDTGDTRGMWFTITNGTRTIQRIL